MYLDRENIDEVEFLISFFFLFTFLSCLIPIDLYFNSLSLIFI